MPGAAFAVAAIPGGNWKLGNRSKGINFMHIAAEPSRAEPSRLRLWVAQAALDRFLFLNIFLSSLI
jgi:hypothetical protein